MTGARIRVLVADDDDTMRSALEVLVQSEPELELAASARDAPEAIAAAAKAQPDVALIDVRMPGGGGLSVAKAMRRASPRTRILVLSSEEGRDTVLAMLEAGAVGYLVKSSPIDAITASIRQAASGRAVLAAEVIGGVVEELAEHLNARRRADGRRRRSHARIRRALDRTDAFEMAFQPIYELRTRETVGAEALARFKGPPIRAPDRWFAEAGEVGLGVDLELAAARKALEALNDLPAGCYLSINVSPRTLLTAAFRNLVEAHSPERIVTEITEHAPIADYERLGRGIARLRDAGVRLAIDDAGAGFASLRHILRLDPDIIKLDRTLIGGIEKDRSLQALAVGLISFADRMDATIIAEGIERSAELAALASFGARCGQGFYLARPAPLPLPRMRARRTRTA